MDKHYLGNSLGQLVIERVVLDTRAAARIECPVNIGNRLHLASGKHLDHP